VPQAIVILNPVAGNAVVAEVHRALASHFGTQPTGFRVFETTGHERLAELAAEFVKNGAEIVVAAGGDGTVSGVAAGLVGTPALLGVIPLGTTNVLAQELGIPLIIDDACALIAGPHSTRAIDAMRARGAYYFTQIGVGIDSMMIRDTNTEAKRRFGKLAYLWAAFVHLIGFQPRRFHLVIDGRTLRCNASQIVLANSGTLGQQPLRWGLDIRPDDSQIDVCIVRAKTLLDYVILFVRAALGMYRTDRNVRYFIAEQAVTISTKKPLPVQADGEIIGDTTVNVEVVPRAVRVVTPNR
jgi:YegS/Rv2252/BmrU family lipid kinase